MKTIKGKPTCIKAPILGRVVTGKNVNLNKHNILLSEQKPLFAGFGNLVILPESVNLKDNHVAIQVSRSDFDSLKEGDILSVNTDGTIQVLWEESSNDNLIYTTDFCNSSCIMCPQIPQGKPYSYFEQNKKIISLVKDHKLLKTIGISGGEPTIFKDEIVSLLDICQKKFPLSPVAMLTNGKNFDEFDFAKKCAMSNRNVTYCIPIYASYEENHDYIVGSKGSFQRTIKGIYNLIRLKCPIEIRTVIMRQNYKELPMLIDYIFQNLPFVVHVALMGMETTGMAKNNLEDVWIDPIDYMNELRTSVLKLRRNNLNFSIYNIPRCLLAKELYGFDRDSISAWKKSYLEQCGECSEKNNCCGIFATSVKHSTNIKPIK